MMHTLSISRRHSEKLSGSDSGFVSVFLCFFFFGFFGFYFYFFYILLFLVRGGVLSTADTLE